MSLFSETSLLRFASFKRSRRKFCGDLLWKSKLMRHESITNMTADKLIHHRTEVMAKPSYLEFIGFNVAGVVWVVLAPDFHELDARLEWIIEAEEQQEVLLHWQELRMWKFEMKFLNSIKWSQPYLGELTDVNFAVLIVVISLEEARF